MLKSLLFFVNFFLFVSIICAQNVGIGTNTPHSSARLDINSVNSGLLPPRMTALQRNDIINPVAGLIVYCSDCGDRGEMQYYDGVDWRSMNMGFALSKGILNHTCGATNVHNPSIPYGVVSDYDGNLYKTVKIGTQTWMAENLRTTTYSTGVKIPQITNETEWLSNTTGAYRSINNDAVNDCPYGKLYNWYATTNINNLCPSGWRVPSIADLEILNTFLGPGVSGGKMKSAGTQYWLAPNTDATNMSGFSGLPGGGYGQVNETGNLGIWWTSEIDISYEQYGSAFVLSNVESNLNWTGLYKFEGYPVRCIKN